MRATPLLTAVLGGFLVAGCSTALSGTALPGSAARTPTTSNDFGAPKITTPLDTAKFQPNPCTALTQTQQQSLGIAVAGHPQATAQGSICQWSLQYDAVYGFGFNVRFPQGEATGLANAYQNAGQGGMQRVPDVDGQPAAVDPSQDTGGLCAVYLGATDQVDYVATVSLGPDQPNYQNPCSVAQQIAAAATATMKSGKSGSG